MGEAVRWLVARSPLSPALSSAPLLQLVEGALCHQFYRRVHHDTQQRAQAALGRQDPAAIIQLFNGVLVYLAGVLGSERLSRVSWPPPEFSRPENRELVPPLDWNVPQHLAWLRRVVLGLQLPVWDLPPQDAPWARLCDSVFRYVSGIPGSSLSQPLLVSRVENLLARVRARHLRGGSEAGPFFHHVPWDDVLVLCIEHRLNDFHGPEGTAATNVFTDPGDVLVYFYEDQLNEFVPPESWAAAVRRTHKEKQQNTDGSNVRAGPVLSPAAPVPRTRLFRSRVEAEVRTSAPDVTRDPTPEERQAHLLLSSIEHEKAESQRFTEQLQRWTDETRLDLSGPLLVPSTLLLVPEMVPPKCQRSKQTKGADPPGAPSARRKVRAASLTERLEELDWLIVMNREEELACSLRINNLLSIVED